MTPAPILEVSTPTAALSENIGTLPVDNQEGCDSGGHKAVRNPASISTLEVSSAITVPQVHNDALRVSANATTPSHTCPVQECQENADYACDQCQLKFCSALHGSHISHTCQQLKAGYTFKGNWVAPAEQAVNEEVDVINMLGGSKKTSQRSKRKYEEMISVGVPVAAVINTAVTDVAARIRKLAKATGPSVIEENLKRELNFECYHVEFLMQLSNELKLDISRALDVRRPTRVGVMNEVIAKLLCKL